LLLGNSTIHFSTPRPIHLGSLFVIFKMYAAGKHQLKQIAFLQAYQMGLHTEDAIILRKGA
jgi:hypothetical protein